MGSFLIFSFGLYWFARDLRSEADAILTARNLTQGRSERLDTLDLLQEQAIEATGYQRQMDLLLPNQDQLLDFPAWIEGLASVRQVGVDFVFQGSETEPQGGAAGFADFSFVAQGGYDRLVSFLQDLEVAPRQFLLDFTAIKLSRAGDSFTATVDGKLFFR